MSIEAAIADYLAGIATLRSAVAGMTPDQLRARPIPGKWSTMEVVAHLADFEPIYADRIKRIVSIDRPLLLAADHDAYAAHLGYQDRDLEEELAVIESTRRQLARTIPTLPTGAMDRVGIIRNDGGVETERTALLHLTLITGHIPNHLKHVAEKRTALGLG